MVFFLFGWGQWGGGEKEGGKKGKKKAKIGPSYPFSRRGTEAASGQSLVDCRDRSSRSALQIPDLVCR